MDHRGTITGVRNGMHILHCLAAFSRILWGQWPVTNTTVINYIATTAVKNAAGYGHSVVKSNSGADKALSVPPRLKIPNCHTMRDSSNARVEHAHPHAVATTHILPFFTGVGVRPPLMGTKKLVTFVWISHFCPVMELTFLTKKVPPFSLEQ